MSPDGREGPFRGHPNISGGEFCIGVSPFPAGNAPNRRRCLPVVRGPPMKESSPTSARRGPSPPDRASWAHRSSRPERRRHRISHRPARRPGHSMTAATRDEALGRSSPAVSCDPMGPSARPDVVDAVAARHAPTGGPPRSSTAWPRRAWPTGSSCWPLARSAAGPGRTARRAPTTAPASPAALDVGPCHGEAVPTGRAGSPPRALRIEMPGSPQFRPRPTTDHGHETVDQIPPGRAPPPGIRRPRPRKPWRIPMRIQKALFRTHVSLGLSGSYRVESGPRIGQDGCAVRAGDMSICGAMPWHPGRATGRLVPSRGGIPADPADRLGRFPAAPRRLQLGACRGSDISVRGLSGPRRARSPGGAPRAGRRSAP